VYSRLCSLRSNPARDLVFSRCGDHLHSLWNIHRPHQLCSRVQLRHSNPSHSQARDHLCNPSSIQAHNRPSGLRISLDRNQARSHRIHLISRRESRRHNHQLSRVSSPHPNQQRGRALSLLRNRFYCPARNRVQSHHPNHRHSR